MSESCRREEPGEEQDLGVDRNQSGGAPRCQQDERTGGADGKGQRRPGGALGHAAGGQAEQPDRSGGRGQPRAGTDQRQACQSGEHRCGGARHAETEHDRRQQQWQCGKRHRQRGGEARPTGRVRQRRRKAQPGDRQSGQHGEERPGGSAAHDRTRHHGGGDREPGWRQRGGEHRDADGDPGTVPAQREQGARGDRRQQPRRDVAGADPGAEGEDGGGGELGRGGEGEQARGEARRGDHQRRLERRVRGPGEAGHEREADQDADDPRKAAAHQGRARGPHANHGEGAGGERCHDREQIGEPGTAHEQPGEPSPGQHQLGGAARDATAVAGHGPGGADPDQAERRGQDGGVRAGAAQARGDGGKHGPGHGRGPRGGKAATGGHGASV